MDWVSDLRSPGGRPSGQLAQAVAGESLHLVEFEPSVGYPVQRDVLHQRAQPTVWRHTQLHEPRCYLFGAFPPLSSGVGQPLGHPRDLVANQYPSDMITDDGEAQQIPKLVLQLVGRYSLL